MFKFLKELDMMIIIIVLTIVVGVVVITMRSKTYSIGYEIAALKDKEKSLRQRQVELQSGLADAEHTVRDALLAELNSSGKQKYILPDHNHVIKVTNEE